MRLIDTHSGDFVEFADPSQTPPYAILSHTWDREGEQAFREVETIQREYKLKIVSCMSFAASLVLSLSTIWSLTTRSSLRRIITPVFT